MRIAFVTYDLSGVRVDKKVKIKTKYTSMVMSAHNLINAFQELGHTLYATRSVHTEPESYDLVPEKGNLIHVQEIQTGFDNLFLDENGVVSKNLSDKYYEYEVFDKSNPVYLSLANQYSNFLEKNSIERVFSDNINPIVSFLKMEELGILKENLYSRIEFVCTIHDIAGHEKRLNYIAKKLKQTKLKIKLAGFSNHILQLLISLGIDPSKILKTVNGYNFNNIDNVLFDDDKKINKLLEENHIPNDKKIIICPARRVPNKGHKFLIEAVNILQRQGLLENFVFVLTGAGAGKNKLGASDYDKELLNLISYYNLQDKIILAKELNYDEIINFIDISYAAVLPSIEPEGLAFSNLEAMYLNKPIVTSSIGGPLNYVNPGINGLLCKPCDSTSLANQLEKIIKNKWLYRKISRNASRCTENYTLESSIKSYISLI